MASDTRLYIGTTNGLFVTQSTNGGWKEPTLTLPNAFCRCFSSSSGRESVYLALGKDGLVRSDNGGQHWTKIREEHVRAVMVDPTDDNVIYAGSEPVALWRSEDRGATWEELSALQDLPQEKKDNWWFPTPPHQGHVLQIFVHPDDPRIIYMSIEHGGIVRSLDRGATWEDVTDGIDYLDIHQVSSQPHSFDRYYASTAKGFFTSSDPSAGWTRAEQGMTRDYFHDFIFFPPKREGGAPSILISSADGTPGDWDRPGVARGAVFRTDDGAASWQRVIGEGLPDEMEENPWAISGHPEERDTAYVGLGGFRRPGSTIPGTILRTQDRGDTWQRVDVQVPLVLLLLAAPI
ncbi:MAG: repeat-containing glycosyl hydrolase [Chloroflexi bacterium]|nr:repeat-containing glycosyl hydrolase [Chloroflexota bacterium]